MNTSWRSRWVLLNYSRINRTHLNKWRQHDKKKQATRFFLSSSIQYFFFLPVEMSYATCANRSWFVSALLALMCGQQ